MLESSVCLQDTCPSFSKAWVGAGARCEVAILFQRDLVMPESYHSPLCHLPFSTEEPIHIGHTAKGDIIYQITGLSWCSG